MAITWLLPVALGGLLLTAVPIAIHLLVRQQSRRMAFPSLRFLQPSRLAALRRRTIQDALLLTCRVLIIALAVAALAAPVFQTSGRDRVNASREVRAIVVAPGDDVSAASPYSSGAFRSSVFSRVAIADAIGDALAWLEDQPPAAHELVVVGTFRRGQVEHADLAMVPSTTGIRLARVATPATTRDLEFPVLVRRGSELMRIVRRVHVEDGSTTVSDGQGTRVPEMPIRVVAPANDAALADAALRAVLTAGVRWPSGTQPLQVAWPANAADGTGGGRAWAATTLAHAIEDAVAAPTAELEPVRASDEELARWSRPPGPPPAGAHPADEGDRRWLWGAVLVLLGVEHFARRSAALKSQGKPEGLPPPVVEEARVA